MEYALCYDVLINTELLMKSVYIAGPDVFRLDWSDFCSDVTKWCNSLELSPIFPIPSHISLDQYGLRGMTTKGNHEDAVRVFKACHKLVESADIIVANISPFRGEEPDSGTVFEIGLGYNMGKAIVGYSYDQRTPVDRLIGRSSITEHGGVLHKGHLVEDFSIPVNLMVACACHKIVSTVEEALNVASTL